MFICNFERSIAAVLIFIYYFYCCLPSFVCGIRYAHDFQVDAPWCTKCRRPPEHITAASAEQQLCSVSSERPPPAFYSFLESIAVNPPRNPIAFYKDGIKSNATSAIITAPIPTRASQAFDLKGWLDPLHPRLGDYEYGTIFILLGHVRTVIISFFSNMYFWLCILKKS